MVKCKYEGTGIWNGRCTGTKEVDPCPGYDKCKQYKPNYTTNAERVRAMNAEQLAEWALFRATQIGREYSHSLIGLITWLQQPSEEGE